MRKDNISLALFVGRVVVHSREGFGGKRSLMEALEQPDEAERRKRRRLNVATTTETRRYTSADVDDAVVEEIVSFAKLNRPRALTREERLDILLLQAYLRSEHNKKSKKAGAGRKPAPPKVSRTVSKILRRKEQLVKNVWTVWAIVKGEVGRQYTTETTFKQVLVRLKDAFDKLQPHTVQGCINKANKNLAALHRHVVKVDELEAEEEDNGGNSTCSEGDSSDSGDISDDESDV